MLVDIKTPGHDGQAILKLSDGEPLHVERERQEQARSASTDLARRIPDVAHAYAEQSRSALLMTVAGRGLLETETMANAAGARLNLASQKNFVVPFDGVEPYTVFCRRDYRCRQNAGRMA